MKLFATAVAFATLTAAVPAFAEGDNPITNAVKDNHMMWTGRYELPGQRAYDAMYGRRAYRPVVVAPRYGSWPDYRPAPVYGYPEEPVYGGVYVGGGRFYYDD